MRSNKDINELIAKFYNARAALDRDNLVDERIFSSNSAPQPSYSLIADIKEVISAATLKHRQRTYSLIWQYAAAAAVIIMVFGTSITLLYKPTQQIEIYTSGVFGQDTLSSIETTIDAQFAQLESSEPDSALVTLESIRSPEVNAIIEIASELDDIAATFWKG